MKNAQPANGSGPLIFISAAEPSADLHGASLIRATHRLCPSARFVGVAGPKMVAAGCDSIYDMTAHSAMLLEVVRIVGRGIELLKTADRHLRRYPFDAAVVIDSPTLHFPLAADAQAAGVPVLYYIAPQIWAWGAYRIHKLRNRADRVAVILPFEEAYFRNQGIDARYVGHPLAEQWREAPADEVEVARIRSRGGPVVVLLPGSRKHVVQSLLDDQLAVASDIAKAFPKAVFGVSVANSSVEPLVKAAIALQRDALRPERPAVTPFMDHRAEWIAAADLVLVASGTSALQVAFQQRPMIVMYKSSRFFYHLIARWLLNTPNLSLPNILAGRRIVPEFMPYYPSTEPIAEAAITLLRSEKASQKMIQELGDVVAPLVNSEASKQTALMLLDMIDANRH